MLRIAVVQADLAQKQTEPHEAAETLQGQNSLGQNLAKRILGKPDGAGRNELARNQVPLSVVAPEWAARNPGVQNAAALNPAARNLVAQNLVAQNAAVAQNAVVAVAVRKASNTSSLCDSNPSVSFPRASRLACRSKIDTLRPVGNPWHGGAIPRAPHQGLPI